MKTTKRTRLLLFIALFSPFLSFTNLPEELETGELYRPVFLKNEGQWESDILFRSITNGLKVAFLKDRVVFQHTAEQESEHQEVEYPNAYARAEAKSRDTLTVVVWSMEFQGANPLASPTAENPHPSVYSYLLGNDPDKWKTKIAESEVIWYRDLYPGIDLKFYFSAGRLKYDYIISPGADPAQIQVAYEGIGQLEISPGKGLKIHTASGVHEEAAPYAWQQTGEGRVEVQAAFVLTDEKSYHFQLSGYDPDLPLVLDPLFLGWASYGANFATMDAYCFASSVGPTGEVMIVGHTNPNMLITPGVFQPVSGGLTDGYVMKFSADGSTLLAVTFLGGAGFDFLYGIETDSVGNHYLTGYSGSVNFPWTPGAYSTVLAGTSDGVVVKMNADLTGVIYGTFLGGADTEILYDIELMPGGEVIVCGETRSGNFPVTAGAWITTFPGVTTGFISRLNANGTGLSYSTYIGGAGVAKVVDIFPFDNGKIAFVGNVDGTFPVPITAYQPAYSGSTDIIVGILNPTASGLIGATYLGGAGADYGNGIAVTENGEIWAGGTVSGGFVTSSGAMQTSNAGIYDIGMAHLNANLTSMIAGTFIGGSFADNLSDIEVAPDGSVFVSGYTNSSNFPISGPCVFQTNNAGASDNVIFQLLPDCSGFGIGGSTYFGGSSADYYNPDLSWDTTSAAKMLAFSGTTHSLNFPATAGAAFTTNLTGGDDSPTVGKFLTPIFSLGEDRVNCNTGSSLDSLNAWIPGGTYLWSTGDTTPAIAIPGSGQYWVQAQVPGCSTIYTDTIFIVMDSIGIAEIGSDSTYCGNDSVTFSTVLSGFPGTAVSFQWSTGDSTPTLTIDTSGTYWVQVSTVFGCSDSDTVVVDILPAPEVQVSPGITICGPANVPISGSSIGIPALFGWNTGDSTTNITVSNSGVYWFEATAPNGCTDADSVVVQINAPPVLNLGPDITACNSTPVTLDAGAGWTQVIWGGGLGTGQTLQVTSPGFYVCYVTDSSGCGALDTIEVSFEAAPTPALGPDIIECEGIPVVLSPGTVGTSLLWSDGSTGPVLFPTTSGTYWVEVTSAIGCTGRDSVNIIFEPIPVPDLGPDQVHCDGETLILSPGITGTAYQWSTGQTTQTISVTQNGIFAVTVTNAAGCVGSDEIEVNFIPAPQIDLGNDQTVCAPGFVTLDASGSNGTSWQWSNGYVANAITVNQSGTYSVTVTNAGGCTATDQVTLDFIPSPVPDLKENLLICDSQTVYLMANVSGVNFQWSTGDFGPVLAVNAPGLYAVTVTDTNGCQGTDQVTVGADVTPAPYLGEDRYICGIKPQELYVSAQNAQISWFNGQSGPKTTVFEAGWYEVTVTNQCGSGTDSVRIEMDPHGGNLYYPNAFTPNGDGINDFFEISAPEESYHLEIFDRWGKLMFESFTPQSSWDGKWEQNDAAEGVYVFVLEYLDCRNKVMHGVGNLTLYR